MFQFTAKKMIYFLLVISIFSASLIGFNSTFENIVMSLITAFVATSAVSLIENLSTSHSLKPLVTAVAGGSLALFFCRFLFSSLLPLASFLNPMNARYLALIDTIASLMAGGWGALIALRSEVNLIALFPSLAAKSTNTAHRDLLLDVSALQDPRIYDIASTGIFDKRLAVAQFVIAELHANTAQDDPLKTKARRSGEIIRNLEELPHLGLKIIEDTPSSDKDVLQRLLNLAQKTKADVITSERYRLQPTTTESVHIFNLHTLASAFKPLTQSGEIITIKVQRYGKEIKQGVGYLEDNTMVVINGGGDFLGKTIRAQVLSVKHTLSGRMIFCNALSDDHGFEQEDESDDVFNTKSDDDTFHSKAENESSFI